MNLDRYLLTGFNVLINNTVVIDGVTMQCVYNEVSNSNRKDYTFIDESDCSIMVKTSDLNNAPRTYIGKNVTLNNDTWKIVKVKTGNVTTTFILVSNHRG